MKEIRLKISVKNNLLLKRREALKLTQAQLASRIGVQQNQYSALECLSRVPFDKKGDWSEVALRVASFHKCDVEDLWPEEILKIKNNKTEREIGFSELADLSTHDAQIESPEEMLIRKQRDEYLESCVNGLSTREQIVIKIRNGWEGDEGTLDVVGQELYVMRERVRQIEAKALRKLRHPTKAGKIEF